MTDENGKALKGNQHEVNKRIEAYLDSKDEFETLTNTELDFLLQYTGAGGLISQGATGRGVLHEFYTPSWLGNYMFQLAKAHGFKGGTILEPSAAIGRLLEPFGDKSKITAFEINPYTAKILKLRFPKVEVYNDYFETAFLEPVRKRSLHSKLTWLSGYPFDLVIGNPPYGKYFNKYSGYFKKDKYQLIEFFFFDKALDLLKPGGLLVFLVGQNVLRTGDVTYAQEINRISNKCEFVDAYRVHDVFQFSGIPTDIIILKKK